MSTRRERSQACDDAITAAALEELREHGYRGLTMLAVIDRAGVSSATLYRRWPTKQALVAATLATLATTFDPVDTGSLEGDLEVVARHVAKAIVERDDLGAMASEVAQDEELNALCRAAFTEPRLAQIAAVLDRAAERGELPKRVAPDVVHSLLSGPLYHRAVLLDEKLTPAFVRTVVRGVKAALSA